ncbi:sigma-70 family RNA polymerase sigma factor [Streptomyces sp. NPDC055109]
MSTSNPNENTGPPLNHESVLVEKLYREHGVALLRITAGLCGGDRQLAEDVVQETLIRAWKHADQLAMMEPSGIRPWLVTVARRIAIDSHRAKSARPSEADPAPLEFLPAPDYITRALEVMLISDALDSLSESHRQALTETYLYGRTVVEAAQKLKVPPGTMKSRIYYALHSMRLALQEQEEKESLQP